MEDFNGMSRATVRSKIPQGMWEFGRNKIVTKKFTSIVDEDGFDTKCTIPGNEIGVISSNDHTVYFSIDGEHSCIGYSTTNGNTYIPVLRTTLLTFNIGFPIEGVYFYNYKGELIIVFCDGAFLESNTIKLINLFNLGVDVDGSYELVNPEDIEKLNLNVPIQEAQIDIDYTDTAVLTQDVVYISYCYILSDGISTSPFFPIGHIAYPTHNFRELTRRGITLDFTELDLEYNRIRLGILVNTENGLEAYQSNIISYSGSTLRTGISSLANYTSINVDVLLVPAIIYSKAGTITIQNNRLAIGEVVAETKFDFQKFSNLLHVEPVFVDEDLDDTYEEDIFTHPTLCFGEVYSISIQPQLKNGQYLDSYHIPGRVAEGIELTYLSDADLIANGLEDLVGTDTYRNFRLDNNGAFVLPPPYVNTLSHRIMTMGYWHNEDETYPNDDEFNSTVDYNGNPIVGGEDLRGTFKRHHRIPELINIISKIPSIVGNTYTNTHNDSYDGIAFRGKVPRIGIRITNFNTIVPLEIREQLQGFKINIHKRTEGNRLVEDICFIKQLSRSQQNVDGTIRTILTPQFRDPVNTEYRTRAEQFGRCVLYSTTLNTYKPSLTSQLIQANYAIRTIVNAATPAEITIFTDDFYQILEGQRLGVINNIEYLPGNNIVSETLFTEDKVVVTCRNSKQGTDGLADVGPNRWNPLLIENTGDDEEMLIDKWNPILKGYLPFSTTDEDYIYSLIVNASIMNLVKNVYVGFDNNDFITLGRVSLSDTTEVVYKNGDIFVANKMNYPLAIPWGTNINGIMAFFNFNLIGNFAINNNCEIYIEDTREYRLYQMNSDSETSVLATFQYNLDIFNKEVFRSLNDKATFLFYNPNTDYIDYFPYRVALGQAIQNENLQTNNVRTFLANDYYEMPNNKGKIIALRGTTRRLYIQQKYALFIATIKDTLTVEEGITYLGQGDIFDRIPEEVRDSDKGYIGSTSKFACILIPDYLVTVDQIQGKIFLVGGNGVLEISKANMEQWFNENWDNGELYSIPDRNGDLQRVDNPQNAVGHLVGYDSKNGRLLFTKKYYENNGTGSFTFDGQFYYSEEERMDYNNAFYFTEKSKTFSFNIEGDKKVWLFEHDYFPNTYYSNNLGMFSIYNNLSANDSAMNYKHNSTTSLKRLFYGQVYDSYVDLVFNTRYDLSKLYKAVIWNSNAYNRNTNSNIYNDTITAITIYNDFQCSGEIILEDYTTNRNTEGMWQFNEFRDIVINKDAQIINKDGNFNLANLNNNKSWFEKSLFISTFIVVRMTVKGETFIEKQINQVNVLSKISQR